MSNMLGAASSIIGLVSVFWVFYLGVAILAVVAKWKLFEKAGEPGWAAVVPFYNSYVLFKLSWGNGWYFLLTTVPAFLMEITYFVFYLSMIGQGIVTSYPANFNDYAGVAALASSAVWFGLFMSIVSLGVFAVKIIAGIKLAHAFGQSGGFAAGLILLNLIFLCILAFSRDIVYVGVPGKSSPNGSGAARPNDWQPVYKNPYYQPQDWQETGYQPQGTVRYCTACGAQLRSGDRFCRSCGKPQ